MMALTEESPVYRLPGPAAYNNVYTVEPLYKNTLNKNT